MTLQPKRTVLVVEDEPLLVLGYVMVLEQTGFEVLATADTVEEGLRLLETLRPDIVTLDLNLKGILATPIAQRLRELGIPFVVLSAYSHIAAFHPVFDGVPSLSKPVEDRELIAIIETTLAATYMPVPSSFRASVTEPE